MKRNLMKIIGTAVLAFAVILMMTSNSVFAQDKSEDRSIELALQNNNGGGTLDGTWDIVLTVRNCRNNAPIINLLETNTYMFGGTMINTTAGVPPSRRTTGLGVWKHIRGNTYSYSFKAFTFDANNSLTGWLIGRQELNLYGDLYFSSGRAEIYDANGNFLSTGCSTTTATRFE